MTITKEQVAQWACEAGTGAIPITALDIKFAQLAYTAGAEAKLAELANRERMLTDEELTDPQYMKAYTEGCNETIAEILKYSKALTAERDALAKKLDTAREALQGIAGTTAGSDCNEWAREALKEIE